MRSGVLRVACRPLVRCFRTTAEHSEWKRRIVASRMLLPAKAEMTGEEAIPMLWEVDRLAPAFSIQSVPVEKQVRHTPSASLLDVTWPIASDPIVKNSVSSLSQWGAVRMSKFYEALDALTGDVAYHHTDGLARGLTLVTASHSYSEKIARTEPGKDFKLRCYVTDTGSSSLEVRTDALVIVDGEEHLVNFCHTVMVALDKSTMRPIKGAIPALVLDPEDAAAQNERSLLSNVHKDIRSRRASMRLAERTPMRLPPTHEELTEVHDMHLSFVRAAEAAAPRGPLPDTISQHKHSTSMVVFPEHRNVQGTLFGGQTASQSFELAYFAAKFFMRGYPFVPIGLDEAVFLQPINIGDLVKFTARVVHASDTIFRVLVTVEVVNPSDPNQLPKRTNNLRFVFAGHPEAQYSILPQTYGEVLMHMDAARVHAVEHVDEELLRDVHAYLVSRGPVSQCKD